MKQYAAILAVAVAALTAPPAKGADITIKVRSIDANGIGKEIGKILKGLFQRLTF